LSPKFTFVGLQNSRLLPLDTDSKVLPSIEEIEAIEQQRQKAIESLQVSNGQVKCQRCGNLHALRPPMINAHESGRRHQLEQMKRRTSPINNWIDISMEVTGR
jgi:hypothetical protein